MLLTALEQKGGLAGQRSSWIVKPSSLTFGCDSVTTLIQRFSVGTGRPLSAMLIKCPWKDAITVKKKPTASQRCEGCPEPGIRRSNDRSVKRWIIYYMEYMETKERLHDLSKQAPTQKIVLSTVGGRRALRRPCQQPCLQLLPFHQSTSGMKVTRATTLCHQTKKGGQKLLLGSENLMQRLNYKQKQTATCPDKKLNPVNSVF